MSTDSNISLVTKNTVFFATSVCETIAEMTGNEYRIYSDVFTDNEIALQQDFLILIPFSGRIQGNCYLCLDEKVCASLCGMYQEGMSLQELHAMRSDYSSFLLEVINIAAAKTISRLEKDFKPLFVLPPYVIFGKAQMPSITSGDVMIKGDMGTIQCALSLDLAKLHANEKSPAGEAPAADPVAPVATAAPDADLIASVSQALEQIGQIRTTMESILKKSKLPFLEDANQNLVKLLASLPRNPLSDELTSEYQLIEKGLQNDQGKMRDELQALEQLARGIKALCLAAAD